MKKKTSPSKTQSISLEKKSGPIFTELNNTLQLINNNKYNFSKSNISLKNDINISNLNLDLNTKLLFIKDLLKLSGDLWDIIKDFLKLVLNENINVDLIKYNFMLFKNNIKTNSKPNDLNFNSLSFDSSNLNISEEINCSKLEQTTNKSFFSNSKNSVLNNENVSKNPFILNNNNNNNNDKSISPTIPFNNNINFETNFIDNIKSNFDNNSNTKRFTDRNAKNNANIFTNNYKNSSNVEFVLNNNINRNNNFNFDRFNNNLVQFNNNNNKNEKSINNNIQINNQANDDNNNLIQEIDNKILSCFKNYKTSDNIKIKYHNSSYHLFYNDNVNSEKSQNFYKSFKNMNSGKTFKCCKAIRIGSINNNLFRIYMYVQFINSVTIYKSKYPETKIININCSGVYVVNTMKSLGNFIISDGDPLEKGGLTIEKINNLPRAERNNLSVHYSKSVNEANMNDDFNFNASDDDKNVKVVYIYGNNTDTAYNFLKTYLKNKNINFFKISYKNKFWFGLANNSKLTTAVYLDFDYKVVPFEEFKNLIAKDKRILNIKGSYYKNELTEIFIFTNQLPSIIYENNNFNYEESIIVYKEEEFTDENILNGIFIDHNQNNN